MEQVILIDDSENIHKFVIAVLESKGYEVKSYYSAEEAIFSLAGKVDAQLILLDIMMPGLDGFDFLASTAKDLLQQGVKICCLTGKSTPADVQKAMKYGVRDYILKPIQIPVLVEKVESLIGPADIPDE